MARSARARAASDHRRPSLELRKAAVDNLPAWARVSSLVIFIAGNWCVTRGLEMPKTRKYSSMTCWLSLASLVANDADGNATPSVGRFLARRAAHRMPKVSTECNGYRNDATTTYAATISTDRMKSTIRLLTAGSLALIRSLNSSASGSIIGHQPQKAVGVPLMA